MVGKRRDFGVIRGLAVVRVRPGVRCELYRVGVRIVGLSESRAFGGCLGTRRR